MNIWVLAILFGVVVMVLGPVMLLQPSTRERRLAELRRQAQEQGLVVSMKTLPRQATDVEAPDRLPVYQIPAGKGGGPAHPWMLVRAVYQHESHFLGHWAWEGSGRVGPLEQQVLEEQLPQMPRSVRAVSGEATGWSVYWTEAGGPEALGPIATLLRELKGCSRPQA